jgi:tubulin polyglutamylase TTLL6/13
VPKRHILDSDSDDEKPVKTNQLIMNLHHTVYPVVKRVAKAMEFKISTTDALSSELDFDVCWVDNPIQSETLARIKPYQRISQYPGIACICNKGKLARGLMKMRKTFPEAYNFFPVTYLLPSEYNEFKN